MLPMPLRVACSAVYATVLSLIPVLSPVLSPVLCLIPLLGRSRSTFSLGRGREVTITPRYDDNKLALQQPQQFLLEILMRYRLEPPGWHHVGSSCASIPNCTISCALCLFPSGLCGGAVIAAYR